MPAVKPRLESDLLSDLGEPRCVPGQNGFVRLPLLRFGLWIEIRSEVAAAL